MTTQNDKNWLAQLVAFVLASVTGLLLVFVAKRYFLKWCAKKGYSPLKGVVVLLVWVYVFGVMVYVVGYLVSLVGLNKFFVEVSFF